MKRTVFFDPRGWEDYVYWQTQDRKTLKRINQLITEVLRDPFAGIGKPEPLKHVLSGARSRRIDESTHLTLTTRVCPDRSLFTDSAIWPLSGRLR